MSVLLMVLSGSRKAILMVSVGLLVYYVFLNRSLIFKLQLVVPLLIFSLIAYQYISQNELFNQRMNTELTRQDMGGRKPIWEAAIMIIKTNPLLGVGIGEFAFQIEYSLGSLRATHNEFLQVAAYGGIVGVFWFILFLSALAKRSFRILKSKDSNFTSLPLALFFMQLIYLFSAGGSFTSFLSWFIYAFIAAKTHPENPE